MDSIGDNSKFDTEIRTLTFPNNAAGQTEKLSIISKMSAEGWTILSETVKQGETKKGKAFCLASICLPFGFLAGKTDGSTTITFQRKIPKRVTASVVAAAPSMPDARPLPSTSAAAHEHDDASSALCSVCKAPLKTNARFCTKCGASVAAATKPAQSITKLICTKCGVELRAGAKFCDKCGTPAQAKPVCKGCGVELRPGAKFCDKCGTPVGAVPSAAPQDRDPDDRYDHDVEKHCRKCNHVLEADATQCPGCGVQLEPRASQDKDREDADEMH